MVLLLALQGKNPRVLKAASEVTLRGLAKITLLPSLVSLSVRAPESSACLYTPLSLACMVLLPALQGKDPRVLKAASEVTLRGLAKITLLGDPVAVTAEAKKLNADISNCRVVDPKVRPCTCCIPVGQCCDV
jgi:phosphotransacetylase